jgi:hypothetical protein
MMMPVMVAEASPMQMLLRRSKPTSPFALLFILAAGLFFFCSNGFFLGLNRRRFFCQAEFGFQLSLLCKS